MRRSSVARGRGSGKKSGSKPTSQARSDKQRIKDRYAHAREDAQLAGLIPTTPEESLKPEQVNPATQSDAPHPELVAQAIRKGWAVPEERKPRLVDELTKIIDNPEAPEKVKVAAFSALRLADKDQYERDNPEEAAKAKGGSKIAVGVNVQNNIDAATAIRQMIESGELGFLEEDLG